MYLTDEQMDEIADWYASRPDGVTVTEVETLIAESLLDQLREEEYRQAACVHPTPEPIYDPSGEVQVAEHCHDCGVYRRCSGR